MYKMRSVHETDRVIVADRGDALQGGQVGEGLVAEHVLAVTGRCDADLLLDAGRGGDVNSVDAIEGQHLAPGVEGMRDAIAVGVFPGRLHLAAGHRGELGIGSLLDHRRHPVGDAAGAHDAPAQGLEGFGLGSA